MRITASAIRSLCALAALLAAPAFAQDGTLDARCLFPAEARALGYLPDGKLLIHQRRAGIDGEDALVTRSADGRERILSVVPPPLRLGRLSPDGAAVVALQDTAGNERYGIRYTPLGNPDKAQPLTPLNTRNAAPIFTPDGAALVYARAAGQSAQWGLLETQLEDAQTRILFQQPGAWRPMGFSRDGNRLLLQEIFGLSDHVLHLFDRPTGLKTPIFAGVRPLAIQGATLSPDGASAYILRNTFAQGGLLQQVDIAKGKLTKLQTLEGPVYGLALSPSGNALAFFENVYGRSRLHRVPLPDGTAMAPIDLPGWAAGLVWAPDSARLALTMSQPGSAPWVEDLDISAASFKASPPLPENCWKVTADMRTIPRAQEVAGQTALPVLVLKPKNVATGPLPTIIYFHGGPEGQSRATGHVELAALANALGAAVILPNIAGSTGYGLHYASLDDGVKRTIVIDEMNMILDWLAAQPDFDANRVVLQGASYGGYAALLGASHFNDRINGAISEVGISHLARFLSETPFTRRTLRRKEYGDERDPKIAKMLEDLSPLNRANFITKPIFLAHGVNDARVPVSQSEIMADALSAQGTPVTLMLLEDAGHLVRNRKKRLSLRQAQYYFLKDHLLNAGKQDSR